VGLCHTKFGQLRGVSVIAEYVSTLRSSTART
jgi:hypothetical protein